MKKTFLYFLLAAILVLTGVFSSCTEIGDPAFKEKAKTDNAGFLQDAAKSTGEGFLKETEFLNALDSILKDGGVNFAVNIEGVEISGDFYKSDDDLAFMLNLPAMLFDPESSGGASAELAVYYVDGALTLDISALTGTQPFTLPKELLGELGESFVENFSNILMGNMYESGMTDLSPGIGSAFTFTPLAAVEDISDITEMIDAVFSDVLDGLKFTVSEKSVKTGGKTIPCIVTKYTLDKNDLKNIAEKINEAITPLFGALGENASYGFPIDDMFDEDFIFNGAVEIAVSQKNNYLVKVSIDASGEEDGEEFKIKAVIDLGPSPSLAQSKSVSIEAINEDETVNMELIWDVNDTKDSFVINAYVSAHSVPKDKDESEETYMPFYLYLNHDKTGGDYTIKLFLEEDEIDTADIGKNFPTKYDPIAEVSGKLNYTDKKLDFTIKSIFADGETLTDLLTVSASKDMKMPALPQATTIETLDELSELFGFETIEEFFEALSYMF